MLFHNVQGSLHPSLVCPLHRYRDPTLQVGCWAPFGTKTYCYPSSLAPTRNSVDLVISTYDWMNRHSRVSVTANNLPMTSTGKSLAMVIARASNSNVKPVPARAQGTGTCLPPLLLRCVVDRSRGSADGTSEGSTPLETNGDVETVGFLG